MQKFSLREMFLLMVVVALSASHLLYWNRSQQYPLKTSVFDQFDIYDILSQHSNSCQSGNSFATVTKTSRLEILDFKVPKDMGEELFELLRPDLLKKIDATQWDVAKETGVSSADRFDLTLSRNAVSVNVLFHNLSYKQRIETDSEDHHVLKILILTTVQDR